MPVHGGFAGHHGSAPIDRRDQRADRLAGAGAGFDHRLDRPVLGRARAAHGIERVGQIPLELTVIAAMQLDEQPSAVALVLHPADAGMGRLPGLVLPHLGHDHVEAPAIVGRRHPVAVAHDDGARRDDRRQIDQIVIRHARIDQRGIEGGQRRRAITGSGAERDGHSLHRGARSDRELARIICFMPGPARRRSKTEAAAVSPLLLREILSTGRNRTVGTRVKPA